MASAAARERFARRGEASALLRAFNALDSKGDKKLDAQELSAYFAARGHAARHRHEAEDMVWEGDEDCDGALSWHEFLALHARARDDGTGTEPRGLHDVVAFAMADVEGKGRVSLEAAMEMTYLRVGRAALDAELAALFGPGGGGEEGGGGGASGNGTGSGSASGNGGGAAAGFELDAGRTLTLTEWLERLGAQQARRLAARPGVGGPAAAAAAAGSGAGTGAAAAGASDDGDEAGAAAAK